jgi:hypothetical protein
MPGPWSRSSEWAEVVATRSRMAKAAERAGLMGAWLGGEFCTAGAAVRFEGRCGERGPVDLVKMLTGVELEVAGELGAGHAGFAFELDLVERENGVVRSADEKLGNGSVELAGLQT